jgi:hypothetical protein
VSSCARKRCAESTNAANRQNAPTIPVGMAWRGRLLTTAFGGGARELAAVRLKAHSWPLHVVPEFYMPCLYYQELYNYSLKTGNRLVELVSAAVGVPAAGVRLNSFKPTRRARALAIRASHAASKRTIFSTLSTA